MASPSTFKALSESQVSEHLQTMADHNIELVFLCEMAEVHHKRPRWPAGWRAVGKGEFMIAHAPGLAGRRGVPDAGVAVLSPGPPDKGLAHVPAGG